ncbi:MAG: RHS repeat protein, partial [Myxococcales bacterium]|nr:RHS repeat protein [Myxococcales bacterium]
RIRKVEPASEDGEGGAEKVTVYRWDVRDRLREVLLPDGRRARYRYDAFARRVEKTLLPAVPLEAAPAATLSLVEAPPSPVVLQTGGGDRVGAGQGDRGGIGQGDPGSWGRWGPPKGRERTARGLGAQPPKRPLHAGCRQYSNWCRSHAAKWPLR